MNSCQVCGSTTLDLENMWKYRDKFSTITGIEINNEAQLCCICVWRLNDAFTFREQALSMHRLLETQSEVFVKNEPLKETLVDVKIEEPVLAVKEENVDFMDYQQENIEEPVESKKVISKQRSKNCKNERKTIVDNGPLLIGCPYCLKTDFPTDGLQAKHINEHIKTEGGLRCDLCGANSAKYFGRRGIRLHMQAVHLNIKVVQQKVHTCPECGKVIRNLKRHLRAIHRIGHEAGYCCDLCGQRFVYKTAIRKHIKFDHLKINQCDVCFKTFFDSHAMKLHKRIHSNVRNHICPICQKGFTQRGNLLEHIDKHDPSCKYLCDICGKLFRSNFLQKHRDSHDPKKKSKQTEVLPFECHVCGQRFKKRYYLLNHERTHSDSRDFLCEFCEQKFKTKSCLQMHLRFHTGENMFDCSACDKKFNSRYRLNFHIKVDHCGIRYECDICGSSYTRQYTLTQHKLKNHKVS